MEDKIKGIQDTLDNIILEIIKKKEYNKNIESESIRKLYFLNDKTKNYNAIDWSRAYGAKMIDEKFNCLYDIIISQNKRITELEQKINLSISK